MQINNIDIMSILLTTGTALLGVVVSCVQYIIGRKNEKKEIEIKYSVKNINANETTKSETINNINISNIEENYLHRLLELYHNQALQRKR